MELLFEFIFGIVFEGSFEVMKSKKAPLWIRIPCGIMVVGLFIAIVLFIGYLSLFIWGENKIASVLLFALDILIIVLVINNIRKALSKKG